VVVAVAVVEKIRIEIEVNLTSWSMPMTVPSGTSRGTSVAPLVASSRAVLASTLSV
jgi:hypothetical protein